MNVIDDCVDVGIAEHLAESGHCTLLTVLDAVAEEFVGSLRIHQLRALPGGTTAVAVAETAIRREQHLDVEAGLSVRILIV